VKTAAAGRPTWPTRPGLLLAIDSRRPASWLTASAAAAAVALVCLVPLRAPEPIAFVVGGLLAVAATGSVPRGLEAAITRLWLAERAAWPLIGVLVACGVLFLWRPDAVGPAAVALGSGIVAGTVTMLATTRRRVPAADAASLVLAVVCGAALLAGIGMHLCGPALDGLRAAGLPMIGVVGGVWLALAGLALAGASRVEQAAATWAAPPVGATVAGPVWLTLLWLAMVTSLTGMAVCFFLAPDEAGWYPLLVLAWFACLALPQGTLLMGDEDAAAWQRLFTSMHGSGFAFSGWRVAATVGSLLGWPAAVAVVVRTAVPDAGGGEVVPAAVVSLGGLAVATAIVSLAGRMAAGSRPARETAFAAACVAVLATMLAVASLPGLPGLPRSGL
jgi:hypothetical protein